MKKVLFCYADFWSEAFDEDLLFQMKIKGKIVQSKSPNTNEAKQIVHNSKESKARMLTSLFTLRNKKVKLEGITFKSNKKAVKIWKTDITLHIVNTLQYEINAY